MDIAKTIDLAVVDGSVALNAFGFVALAGNLELSKQTGISIDDGVTSFIGDVLSLSLTASGFVGTGASLSASNDSTANVETGNAVGFAVPSSSLNLLLVQDQANLIATCLRILITEAQSGFIQYTDYAGTIQAKLFGNFILRQSSFVVIPSNPGRIELLVPLGGI